MPIILKNKSITKINDTFPSPGVEIETFKTSSIRDGDTVVNVPVVPVPQVVSGVSSETIDANYKYMAFKHSGGSEDQTEYSVTFNAYTECDILIVGGGGGGGGGLGESTNGDGTGGGGGGGGLVFIPNITMSNNYNIKIGRGGVGKLDAGENGYESLIEKQDGQGSDGIENFVATGGGGGGDGRTSSQVSGPGVAGGSGGGGGGNSATSGGASTQNTYNGRGFGNAGGDSLSSSGDQSGGGGGAGGVGQSSHASSGSFEGGEGGVGLHKVTIDGIEYKFKDLFGTSYGEYIVDGTTARGRGTAQDYINQYYHIESDTYQSTIPDIEEGVYFGGGGAGKNSATDSYTYGGLGGGASVRLFNQQQVLDSGINGTGGGGHGGGKQNNFPSAGVTSEGTNGGSGIVIIRYKVISDTITMQPQTLTHYTPERMYPPTRDLTSASHVISGQAYGNGVYETWESSFLSPYAGFTAFNISDGIGYSSASGGRYSTSTGLFTSTSYIVSDYTGDWIKIKFPLKINLSRYGFKQRTSLGERSPGFYKIYGSNDNINWTFLVNKTSNPTYSSEYYYESITTTGEYQYFALVVNKLLGTGTQAYILNFDEWFIYGKEYLYDEPDYKVLTFTYDETDKIVYDFTPYNDLASWKVYADSIGATYYLTDYNHNGVYVGSGPIGYIELVLPTEYDTINVVFGNSYTAGTVILYIDNVNKSSCTAGETKTYTQTYTVGQVLKISEENASVINGDLIITFSKTQTPYTLTFDNPTECDILIVGGGGGGGKSGSAGAGGGGGAGGLIYLQNQTINSGSYIIKVGKGGDILTTQLINGYNGYDSSFGDNIAIGGGAGGGNNTSGGIGGSGGGGVSYNDGNDGVIPGTGTTNQGNDGGIGSSSNANSGGGGGSGSVGQNATTSSGGDGGTGTLINITGQDIYYAGGGGGGSEASNNPGLGMAGGGNGGGTDLNGGNATNNTGSGGGGAGGLGYGGSGGSGIVIIRYKQQYNQVPFNAQWTYSALDTSVHHYGNVGIGTTASDTKKLTVRGDVNVIGDYYKNNETFGQWYKNSISGVSIYRHSGNVGVGTSNPGYSLDVMGDVYASEGGISGNGSTSWITTSDSRIKENIVRASYKECYEIFKKINLYRYNYNGEYIDTNDKNQLGFIAQEVKTYLPHSVQERKMKFKNGVYIDDTLTLNVTEINYVMFGAFKYLMGELEIIKKHLPEPIVQDTVVDTNTDTVVDTNTDTVEDTNADTVEDTNTDTVVDTNTEI